MRNSNYYSQISVDASHGMNEEYLKERFRLTCETLDQRSEEIDNRKFTASLARLFEDSIMFFIKQPGTIVQYSGSISQIAKKLYKIQKKAAYIYGGKYSALSDLCSLYKLSEEVSASIKNSEYVFNLFYKLISSNNEVELPKLPSESDKRTLERLSYLGVITISELDKIIIKPTRYSELLVSKSIVQTRINEITISESTEEIVDKSLEQTKKCEITFAGRHTEMIKKSFIKIKSFQDSKESGLYNYFIQKDSIMGGNES